MMSKNMSTPKIISQTTVFLVHPDHPHLGAYKSLLFAEGTGNVPAQLENLKKSLDQGFVVYSVEVID